MDKKWYVMRDISRPRVRVTMYEMLKQSGLEVFTPEHLVLKEKNGKTRRVKEVIFKSLLFVHDEKSVISDIVSRHPCLQFRYQYGRSVNDPMTVPSSDMTRFINAVNASLSEPVYLAPDQITPDMYGREVQIVGGNLDGYTGKLLKMRGTSVKRLIVELPGFFAVGVEVEPEFIRFVSK